MTLRTLEGWIGAAALAAAPFLIDTPQGKAMAIVGLGIFSLHAIQARLWPMVVSNAIAITGFFYALLY